jgi:hypothetical protein
MSGLLGGVWIYVSNSYNHPITLIWRYMGYHNDNNEYLASSRRSWHTVIEANSKSIVKIQGFGNTNVVDVKFEFRVTKERDSNGVLR